MAEFGEFLRSSMPRYFHLIFNRLLYGIGIGMFLPSVPLFVGR